MQNILFLANDDFALLNYRRSLISSLARDNKIHVIIVDQTNLFEDEINVVVKRRFGSKYKTMDYILLFVSILKFLMSNRVDVVFTFTIVPGLAVGLLKYCRSFRHFHTVTGLGRLFNIRKETHFFLRFMLATCFRFTDGFFFQSIEDRKAYSKALRRSLNSKIVNGSGVDTVLIRPSEDKFSPKNRRVIAYIGRVMREKGFHEILNLAAAVRSKGAYFSVVIYGGLKLSQSDKQLLNAAIGEGLVLYKGFTDDVVGELSNIDYLFYSSNYNEGIPRSILEALSAGVVPIINKRIYDTSSHLLSSAIVLNDCNYFDLLRRLEKVDNVEFVKLSSKCRRDAVEFFDIKKVNETYRGVL